MSEGSEPDGDGEKSGQAPHADKSASRSNAPNQSGKPQHSFDGVEDIPRIFSSGFRWFFDVVERRNGAVTAIATVVIAGFTISLALDSSRQAEISQGTLDAIKGQLDAVQQDLRPYIKVETSVVDSIRGRENFIFIPIAYKVSNVGKTHAFDIRVAAITYGKKDPFSDQLHKDQIEACNSLTKKKRLPQEQTLVVFPGETVQWDRGLGTSVPGLGEPEINNIAIIENGRKVVQFWFFVCADYTFGAKREHHQTGYVYQALQLIRQDGIVSKTPSIPINVSIPAGDIRLESMPSASEVTN